MNEQEYETSKQARLNGYTIREIATTNKHRHDFYHKNGYVYRFKHEYPNFPETRGKGKRGPATQKETSAYPKMNEQEYKAFERFRLAGKTMGDIIHNSPHGRLYFYRTGMVNRFNHEHPEYKHNTQSANQLLTEEQIYDDYIEYHRKGLSLANIAKQLRVSVSQLKQVITVHDSKNLIPYADDTLAKQVAKAKRPDKFKILDEYRRKLIADYGTTLMDVPNDEPRLLSLQLANRTLK